MDNEISKDGAYTIMLLKDKNPEHVYYNTYSFEGHIMKMDRPKKGQLVRMPFGELCKIVNIGTERITSTTLRNHQYPAVYLERVPG